MNHHTFCQKSMANLTNHISHSLYSNRCITVELVSPGLSSSSSNLPGFQQTIQFSHDLLRTKSPNHRTQSTQFLQKRCRLLFLSRNGAFKYTYVCRGQKNRENVLLTNQMDEGYGWRSTDTTVLQLHSCCLCPVATVLTSDPCHKT